MARTRTTSNSQSLGLASRIIGTLFFSAFLLMGLFFTAMVGSTVARNLRPWFWTKTDCVIVESSLAKVAEDGDAKWRVAITYRYPAPQSRDSRTSSRVMANETGGGATFDDLGEAQRMVRRFAADNRATCYVEPGVGGDAVLIRSSPWTALAIFFPLIFVAVGASGIAAVWWSSLNPAKRKPLSERLSATHAALFMRGFFLLFFAVGAVTGYAFFVRPAWKIALAKDWPTVPCEIVESGVKTNHDSDGDTHRVAVHYRYRVAGEEFESNRYSFFGGSSSGYRAKQAIADRYRAGSSATCFVNPGDPTDAVLERGFIGELWFGVIPAVFCAAGLLGFLFIKPTATTRARATGLPVVRAAIPAEGSITLKPHSTPMGKFIGMLIFATIWNGAVTIMYVTGEEIPWWFKGIFALVGCVLLSATVYQLLALFTPRPIVTVNRQALPLGGELRLDWAFRGDARRIRRLRIFLRGREEATYRRGTDTSTDRHTFTEVELLQRHRPRGAGRRPRARDHSC